MKHSLYIIIGVALLLLVSCGKRQQAKSVVKDFMEQSLHKEVAYVEFSDIDSTHAISDSLLQALRLRGPKDVQYMERNGNTLFYIRAKYVEGQDTCSTTFYLDKEVAGVIAFKEN